MTESRQTKNVKCGVDVVAGVLPGTPEPEFTRRFILLSEDWPSDGPGQSNALCDLSGKAAAYATLLMLQPDRFNWVRLDWVWF